MSHQTDHVEPQGLDFGPVKVDSTRPVAELGCLAAVLAMLVVFRWAMKRI